MDSVIDVESTMVRFKCPVSRYRRSSSRCPHGQFRRHIVECRKIRNMSGTRTFGNVLTGFTAALLFWACFSLDANSTEKAHYANNADEVEVISIVLAAEAKANNWTKDDLICVSIDDKDPDRKLVKTLRKHGLKVCKASDWHRNFSCGFHVDMRFINLDPSQTARLHATTVDVREINGGVAHVAVKLRDGEYSFRKTEGKWTLADYIPSK